MKQHLESERLKITVDSHGGELCSLYDKARDKELLWQADPAYWKRHAPILFPNVGRHFGDSYRIGERSYPSHQHGFARDMEFLPSPSPQGAIGFYLDSTPETRKDYPFDFRLITLYKLEKNVLTITWRVDNTGTEELPFTIGGHPAFNLPERKEGTDILCKLSFPESDGLSYHLLDKASGTVILDKVYMMPLEDHKTDIHKDQFDNDALVFDGGQITSVQLLSAEGEPVLGMKAESFPNFGIWSVPGAPFICLEPWEGRTDNYGYNGDLRDKKGVTILSPGRSFEKSYSIEVFDR